MATATAAKSSKTATKARVRSISVSPEQRRQMIEESAYFRAEQRAFTGGDPVADWLLSEREVDELLSQSAH
jgi:Protein of unknown function (DUF2934)